MSTRLNLMLAISLVSCALLLVNAQYQFRRLFIELERVQSQSRQIEIEMRQLQLEQSTLSQHARIEAVAKRDLGMVALTPAHTIYLAAGDK